MAKKRKTRSSEPQEQTTPQQDQSNDEQTIPEGEQVDPMQEPAANPDENEQGNVPEHEKNTDNEPPNEVAEENKQGDAQQQVNSSGDVQPNGEASPPEVKEGEKVSPEEEEEELEETKEEDVDAGEESEEESVEGLLEPFSKEQLVVLLKEAVSKYPDLSESVMKLADADPAHRKIFVHGLGWDANAETLTSVFGEFGEIEDCKAVCDKVSGKSKGYGFILFKHRVGARKALKQPQKKIGNRITSCQLASAGPVPAPPPITSPPLSEYTQRKIFVSNVSAEIDPQKLLEFFSKFGEIEEGPLGLDKQTGKPKGFALFVYKTIGSAKKALEEPNKIFEGHTLHCQKAIDGPKTNKQSYFQQHHNQQQHSQYHHHHPSKKAKYSTGVATGSGHLMAPSGHAGGYNPAVAAPALNHPAIGQALTALTALTQGGGLGVTNLLGGLGGPPVNQGGPSVMNNAGYGSHGIGGYGNQPGTLGGYQNPQLGQGNARMQQGGPPYMGHGR